MISPVPVFCLMLIPMCGAFAIGDVRSDSVKRVAAAVGEGAGVVAAIHAYLADADRAKDSQFTKESVHA